MYKEDKARLESEFMREYIHVQHIWVQRLLVAVLVL